MNAAAVRHLFGPVPSRRLGRSLGVDLVPFKTCDFDCIFCQLGRTTTLTLERRPYVPAAVVTEELREWLAAGNSADYITMAGSGEPTLNSDLGEIIAWTRRSTATPVALLTNGALLWDAEVRAAAAAATLVKVSLSAWDQTSLEQVNRPAAGIEFGKVLEGLKRFRREFQGTLWMEVFLVWGTNATPEDVRRIAALAAEVSPDRVQLNTAVRPPCEAYAYAVPQERLQALAGLFTPPAEVIAEFSHEVTARSSASEADIATMLERRPCTLEQICQVFGMHRNEALKYLGKLSRTGRIRQVRQGEQVFYAPEEATKSVDGKDVGNGTDDRER